MSIVLASRESSKIVTEEEKQEQLAQLFKALVHPARIAILDILRNGEQCVCHLEANLGYRQAYISQQLAVLREAGLIQDHRDGLNIYYRIVRPEVFALIDVGRAMVGMEISRSPLNAPQTACPCPRCATKSD
ncbi:MAG: metalloregulator ArsR/SmtB family transcription factor [Chloroflexota bacterium]